MAGMHQWEIDLERSKERISLESENRSLRQSLEAAQDEARILREVMMAPSEPDILRLHHEKCDALDKVYVLQSELAAARKALEEIIEANNDFRAGMPADWDGDPLQDAIDAARAALSSKEPEGE